MRHKITKVTVLPPEEDGTYTISYEFEDGGRGFDSGLSKEEAERRTKRVGEFEEISDTEHSAPAVRELR